MKKNLFLNLLCILLCVQSYTQDANGDSFNDEDVATLKAIVTNNNGSSLGWRGENYGNWEGVLWNSETPQRVYRLRINDKDLKNSMDLSGCKALEFLNCSGNQLKGLDVSLCSKLLVLNCEKNILTSLKTSNCSQLRDLHCSDNNLTIIDVSGNTELVTFLCRNNKLTNIDISKNTKLTGFHCNDNQITDLDIKANASLIFFSCEENKLTSLNTSQNTNLEELYCSGNQLTNLNISNNNKLRTVHCNYNQLTHLDISKDTSLTTLSCYNNQLTHLDISKATKLISLFCEKNQITNLDVSQNTNLEKLYCTNNQLTNLDLSSNTVLTDLWCAYNKLTSLEVSNNTALTVLWCSNNKLTSLDTSNDTALTRLSCNYNKLTSLDLSNNTTLTELSCNHNQLTSLDISMNTALTELLCESNQLTSLDASNNTALTLFRCNSNQLNTLDISKNTNLTQLLCSSNQLNTLDLSNNTALTELSCDYNKLTSLDFSGNKNLTYLNCLKNQLSFSGLQSLLDLPNLDWDYPSYAPQNTIFHEQTVGINKKIDYSPEASIKGTATVFTWFKRTKNGVKRAVMNGENAEIIPEGNGIFTLKKTGIYFCKMTNKKLPKLTLVTHNVNVLFQYKLTASHGKNGTVSPDSAIVSSGDSLTFTITPDEGYQIATATFNGNDVTGEVKPTEKAFAYTIEKVNKDGNLEVTFEKIKYYTLEASAGENGTVTPEKVSVAHGDEQAFIITPDEGYKIALASFNGDDVMNEIKPTEKAFSYTIGNATADGNLKVTFEKISYNIKASAGENGKVSPESAAIKHGESYTLTITPNEGYKIAKATFNDTNVTSELTAKEKAFTFTIEKVTTNGKLEVAFEKLSYNITASAGENGSVTPDKVSIAHGDKQTFTITPDKGYAVASASFNGTDVKDDLKNEKNKFTYTINNVTMNGKLEVTFSEKASGMHESVLSAGVEVYPNPCIDRVQIQGLKTTGKLTIYNLPGNKFIERRNIQDLDMIDVSYLPSGVYIVIIQTGNNRYAQRITKQ